MKLAGPTLRGLTIRGSSADGFYRTSRV